MTTPERGQAAGGFNGVGGGQAEAIRVPQAQGTLVKLPVGEDSTLLPGLLTLADALCTGYHCAVKAGVGPRTTVTVIGDGAVGLSAVIAARLLGAGQIILMGGNKDLTVPVRIALHAEEIRKWRSAFWALASWRFRRSGSAAWA